MDLNGTPVLKEARQGLLQIPTQNYRRNKEENSIQKSILTTHIFLINEEYGLSILGPVQSVHFSYLSTSTGAPECPVRPANRYMTTESPSSPKDVFRPQMATTIFKEILSINQL